MVVDNALKIKIWYSLLALMASIIVVSLILIYYKAFDFEVDQKSFEYTKVTPSVNNKKEDWVNFFL